MKIKHTVKLATAKGSLTAVYVEEHFTQSDSRIKLYDCYKISILLSDGLAAVARDRVINPGKGGILFFRPDEIHFGRFFRDGVHKYLDFYIPCDLFQRLFGEDTRLNFFEDTAEDRINYICPDSASAKTVTEAAVEALRVLKNPNGGRKRDMKLFSLILQTVMLCEENYEAQKKKAPKNEMPVFVTETLSYISEFYAQGLTLDMLADNAGCSVAYLARIFKQYTGKTVYRHITDTRIANAQLFLRQGCSVTEACFLAGFNDCSGFIRVFKELTGKTPLQYKNFEKFS